MAFASVKVLPTADQARVDVVVFAPGVLLMVPILLVFLIVFLKGGQWAAALGGMSVHVVSLDRLPV